MSEVNRIRVKQSNIPIEIPPLPLNTISLPQTAVKLKASKEPIAFLKSMVLDHNADFLKEKTLYRYTISRKLSKNEMNKSQPYLRTCAQGKFSKADHIIENEYKNRTLTEAKEGSEISSNTREGRSRQRHFRRKTEVHQQSAYIRIPGREKTVSVIKQEGCEEQSIPQTHELKPYISNKQITAYSKQPQTGSLAKELQVLKRQNTALRLKYDEKCKALEQMSFELNLMHDEKQKLILENKRLCPINNEHFILDSKIENQLLKRDNFIKELQETIKYLELENSALKKVKIDNSRQSSLIYKLESKNKELENRLKMLSSLRTKRGGMRGSMMSSCSEISLNLSVDDEELDKLYNVLMTTERTNNEVSKEEDGSLRHSMVEELDKTQLSPWWGHKLKA